MQHVSSLQAKKLPYHPRGQLRLPSGETIKTYVIQKESEQIKGLSGVRNHEFHKREGLLFYYKKSEQRQFWMPDTYFNLDIIFLTRDLKIIYVERNLTHHSGRKEVPPIARSKIIKSRHVLEIKSGQFSANKLHPGIQLKWISFFPREKEQETHLQQ